MEEKESLVALLHVPHLGPVKGHSLIRHFGSAHAALHASFKEVASVPGCGEKVAASLEECRAKGLWKKDLELALRLGVQVIGFSDPRYPRRLLEIPDHPLLLYVKGTLLPEDHYSCAIVGTRNASIYGLEMAEKIASDLAGSRWTIVSGLARGIDTAAHRGALRSGRSIAVIGSGLAKIYPSENSALAESLAGNGAVISEFPLMTPPDRQNFPQRNRLVSGMTMGTFLVEAPMRSGGMITMEKAWKQKRKLFALPGRVDVDCFAGNHHLIKSGKAQLVENARDIAGGFDDLFSLCGKFGEEKKREVDVEGEEGVLLMQMPKNELSVDELAQLTKMPIMKLNVLLMSLVLKKRVKEFPGKIYKRI